MYKILNTNNKIVLGFILLNILSGTASGILQMIVPLYALSINANTAQVGLIKGISGLGLMLLVLPSGFLIDHYGSRKLYIIGGVIFSTTIFLFPFAVLPIFIMIIMLFQGFGNSLRMTSLNAAFFKNLKLIGKKRAGWYKGSMSIGLTFLGPLIGGYIVQFISYKNIFVYIGVVTLIPIILLIWLSEKHNTSVHINIIDIFKEQTLDFKLTLNNKIIRQSILIESLSTAAFSCFVTFIVILIVKNYHLPSYYASWLIILEGGVFILVVFTAGELLDKYKIHNLYISSFILSIIGMIFIVLTSNMAFLSVGTLIMGSGLGMTNLITYSQIGEIEGKKGKISALFAACTGIGAAFGPILGGFIGETFGIQAIFLSFIPIFVLSGVYIMLNVYFNQYSLDKRDIYVKFFTSNKRTSKTKIMREK
ncbi:MFS transporter [Clostridium sp. WILCCON 0269]|uniref:MFS transporter n=1 Tax=Candidatus Clostridium eludens TaxID=3381663 RepID=A0ABW8SGV8_9CLOT